MATNESHIKELVAFGFSEKEARVYVSLLELGVGTAPEVANHAKINRSSAYAVLEGLKSQGYAGISDDKIIRRYVAASPEILLQTVRHELKKYEAIKAGIESIIPELKALHRGTSRDTVVKVYEGKNGLISIYEESLNSKEKVLRVASSVESISQLLPGYFATYVKRRVAKQIKMIGIHPRNQTIISLQQLDLPPLDEIVTVPEHLYTPLADIAIYDNKIGYVTAEHGGFGVMLESKEMAEAMKCIFDLALKEAKRINSKHPTKITTNSYQQSNPSSSSSANRS
jgi:sugar-specific transcriptional regulator TrmB